MPFVNMKTGKKATSELLVFLGEFGGDPDGIGVLVYPDGRVTNRWGDGTAGLSDQAREAAAEEVEAYMPYTMDEYKWVHPKPKPKKSSTRRKSTKRLSTPTSIRGLR